MNQEALACAANNVDWHEAVLRSHGLSGAVEGGMWICRDAVPPYHANAVTLSPNDLAAQHRAVRELAHATSGRCSLKDSFALLDPAADGFRVLFSAQWLWLDRPTAPHRAPSAEIIWRRVTSPAELESWEIAWRDAGSPTTTRVFLPDLLAEPIAILAARRGGRIIGGCAANRGAGVVGLSSFFAPADDPDLLLAAAVEEIARFAPGLPLVGYEHGESLERALRLGFRTVGPLRVWLGPRA